MANYPSFNLTGKTPATTYQNIAQFNAASSSLVDGLGNEITTSLNLSTSYAVSSSFTLKAVTASWAPTNYESLISTSWASQSISASWAPSVPSDYSISSSWASRSLSASWAPSSQQTQIDSASWASQSLSSSVSDTSSYIQYPFGAGTPSDTSSPVAWVDVVVGGINYKMPLYL